MVRPNSAKSLPVRILSTLGMRGVLMEIASVFTTEGGMSCEASYQSSNALMRRIAAGETADVAILMRSAIDELIETGKVVPGSRVDLAQSRVGIAVRAGARKPEIGTADAFRRALLAARSIGYSRTGASGIHFASLIERLGIADEIRAKARIQDGLVGELAARGEVEIAVQQLSELLPVPGLDVVGPLPDELQQTVIFSAGVFAGAPNPAGANALIAFLASPKVRPVIAGKGLRPA